MPLRHRITRSSAQFTNREPRLHSSPSIFHPNTISIRSPANRPKTLRAHTFDAIKEEGPWIPRCCQSKLASSAESSSSILSMFTAIKWLAEEGIRKVKPVDPALVRAWALRFDPDQLVLDGGELIIMDVRVEPTRGRFSRAAILEPQMHSEPERPSTAPLPDAAPALVRKLSGKEWVSSNFKAELRALTMTEAANVLAKQSETAANCTKPLQPRYVEKVLRDLGLWPKAPPGLVEAASVEIADTADVPFDVPSTHQTPLEYVAHS